MATGCAGFSAAFLKAVPQPSKARTFVDYLIMNSSPKTTFVMPFTIKNNKQS